MGWPERDRVAPGPHWWPTLQWAGRTEYIGMRIQRGLEGENIHTWRLALCKKQNNSEQYRPIAGGLWAEEDPLSPHLESRRQSLRPVCSWPNGSDWYKKLGKSSGRAIPEQPQG
jgi:hypothetical protein